MRRAFNRIARYLFVLAGWFGALLFSLWRLCLRTRVVDDPRPALRAAGRRYIYAILHAQQLNFVLLSDDTPIAAMVSASKDGDLLVALLRSRGVIPVRGSTRKKGKEKGGRKALAELTETVRGGTPALLAVDGPRGPRNTIHWGVVKLALEADACVVVAGVFPTRSWKLKRTWDRTQLPLPFSQLVGRFRPPVDPRDFAGDGVAMRAHLAAELLALEQEWDPKEAAFAVPFVSEAMRPSA